jgi:hypothetical protein
VKQRKVLDKRTCSDRRVGETDNYTGPEKRKLRDRRSGRVSVCIGCGEVCGDQKAWIQCPPTRESTADSLICVCEACASK